MAAVLWFCVRSSKSNIYIYIYIKYIYIYIYIYTYIYYIFIYIYIWVWQFMWILCQAEDSHQMSAFGLYSVCVWFVEIYTSIKATNIKFIPSIKHLPLALSVNNLLNQTHRLAIFSGVHSLIKALTALASWLSLCRLGKWSWTWLSLSVGWENGPEWGQDCFI